MNGAYSDYFGVSYDGGSQEPGYPQNDENRTIATNYTFDPSPGMMSGPNPTPGTGSFPPSEETGQSRAMMAGASRHTYAADLSQVDLPSQVASGSFPQQPLDHRSRGFANPSQSGESDWWPDKRSSAPNIFDQTASGPSDSLNADWFGDLPVPDLPQYDHLLHEHAEGWGDVPGSAASISSDGAVFSEAQHQGSQDSHMQYELVYAKASMLPSIASESMQSNIAHNPQPFGYPASVVSSPPPSWLQNTYLAVQRNVLPSSRDGPQAVVRTIQSSQYEAPPQDAQNMSTDLSDLGQLAQETAQRSSVS